MKPPKCSPLFRCWWIPFELTRLEFKNQTFNFTHSLNQRKIRENFKVLAGSFFHYFIDIRELINSWYDLQVSTGMLFPNSTWISHFYIPRISTCMATSRRCFRPKLIYIIFLSWHSFWHDYLPFPMYMRKTRGFRNGNDVVHLSKLIFLSLTKCKL